MNGVSPPAWAQALLRSILPATTEENISGDLLEQYRDTVAPARGRRAADRWYVRQVVGFAWRLCGLFVVLRVFAVSSRDVVDVYWPPHDWAAAHAYQFRSALTTYAALLTYLTAGLFAGYSTGRIRAGAVVALFTAVASNIVTLLFSTGLYLVAIRPDASRLRIFEVTGGWGETLGLPVVGLPIVIALGTLGAAAGTTLYWGRRPRATS